MAAIIRTILLLINYDIPCLLHFFSSLKDGFILMKGKLEVPVDYVRRRVLEYKYVVFQMRENNWYGYYEYLLNQPVFTNRCMRIPEMKVNAGGKCFYKFCCYMSSLQYSFV